MKNNLRFKFDTLSFVTLAMTLISILFSLKLAISETILAIGIFLIILAIYIYLNFKTTLNSHATEIGKLNEKINIYRDISDLKAKVKILFNKETMKKRGQVDLTEVLIRIVQVLAILFAGYIILKALGRI